MNVVESLLLPAIAVAFAVAWVRNQKGARNIWIAEAPAYKGRKLTNYPDDDGQEIAQLAWTPHGRSLVFVRGGDFEMQRDNPTPPRCPKASSRLSGSFPSPATHHARYPKATDLRRASLVARRFAPRLRQWSRRSQYCRSVRLSLQHHPLARSQRRPRFQTPSGPPTLRASAVEWSPTGRGSRRSIRFARPEREGMTRSSTPIAWAPARLPMPRGGALRSRPA
jgi:hypothetical protein